MPDLGEIEHDLTKKAGPFPIWVWGVGIGAVVVAVMWMRARSDTSPTVVTTDGVDEADMAADDIDGSLAGSSYDGNDANDQYSNGSSVGSEDTGSDTSDAVVSSDDSEVQAEKRVNKNQKTNAAWQRATVAKMIAQGVNPVAAQRALNLYLAGKPVNQNQNRLIKKALSTGGLPPQGSQSVVVKHKPTAKVQASHQDVKTTAPHTSNVFKAETVRNAKPKPKPQVHIKGKR